MAGHHENPIIALKAPHRLRAAAWLLRSIAPLLILALACMPAARLTAAAEPPGGVIDDWDSATTERFRFLVQPNDTMSAADFAGLHGTQAETALTELELFLDITAPDGQIDIYVYSRAEDFQAALSASEREEIEGVIAVADPRSLDISIWLTPFAALTPLDAENQIRHATAHVMAGVASEFNIPRGFDEGFAQYFERPNTPAIARLAALVQTEYQRGELVSWSNLNRDVPLDDDQLIRAESYAVVAYLIRHHGLPEFRAFLAELKAVANWREAVNAAFAPGTSDSIERQWRDDVPLWAAGEWKWNLVSGFNLEPAREQLRRGNFDGAMAALLISEQLLRDIDDPDRQREATLLKDQARIGGLAEEKMIEAQQALEQFAYDRAVAAVDQAENQYAQLPSELRPDDLLLTYKEMATAGLTASDDLDIARIRSASWGDYPEARSGALSAGTTFASLGDGEMASQSQSLIDQLDQQQIRLVMLLGALAMLTFVWLGLWLWSRGPPVLRWD